MTVDIEGVTLHLAHPDELPVRWVGQEELMRQLLAAWMVLNEQRPAHESAAARQARRRQDHAGLRRGEAHGRDVYILQATMDTRPEDLLVTPVIEGAKKLRYVASPLVRR
jgi:hypothetical protein